jgi:hypothetical protein
MQDPEDTMRGLEISIKLIDDFGSFHPANYLLVHPNNADATPACAGTLNETEGQLESF